MAFLMVAEVGAKIAGLPLGDGMLPNRDNCLQRSALLGMEFKPHCRGRLDVTPFSTNALGLRDNEVENDDATRILALGDSCTWGWSVAQDASYPVRLQQLLDERAGRGRYRVINAGF